MARAEPPLACGGNVPLVRSRAGCVPLGRAGRAIGTTGLAPGTGSPQVPQNASVLTTFALQLLQVGIGPALTGAQIIRTTAGALQPAQ
jgi:hypothetical protein